MTDLASRDAHSALGGSGAHRWMHCAGSVRVAKGHDDPESEHATLGTNAHTLGEYCLEKNVDAWQCVGAYISPTHGICFSDPDFESPQVDKDMADAVQVYIDAVRRAHPDRNQGNSWIERPFHCPSIHPLMYGRGDFVHLESATTEAGEHYRLHVWDYKHGAGIVVEVENNPQLMYYGVAMLTELDLWHRCDEVVLHVAQPRGFHPAGPIREWAVSVAELARWRDEELIPAMNLAERVAEDPETSLDDLMRLGFIRTGEHCRFCPARFGACPGLVADMEEMDKMIQEMGGAEGAPKLTNEQLGRFLDLFEVAKIVQKAARESGYQRAQAGNAIPGWKLAKARANRAWKDDAEKAATKKFGKDALTVPALKSPAEIDKMPGGKTFTAKYAFKPDTGLQLVKESDTRAEVSGKTKAMFEPVKKGRAKK